MAATGPRAAALGRLPQCPASLFGFKPAALLGRHVADVVAALRPQPAAASGAAEGEGASQSDAPGSGPRPAPAPGSAAALASTSRLLCHLAAASMAAAGASWRVGVQPPMDEARLQTLGLLRGAFLARQTRAAVMEVDVLLPEDAREALSRSSVAGAHARSGASPPRVRAAKPPPGRLPSSRVEGPAAEEAEASLLRVLTFREAAERGQLSVEAAAAIEAGLVALMAAGGAGPHTPQPPEHNQHTHCVEGWDLEPPPLAAPSPQPKPRQGSEGASGSTDDEGSRQLPHERASHGGGPGASEGAGEVALSFAPSRLRREPSTAATSGSGPEPQLLRLQLWRSDLLCGVLEVEGGEEVVALAQPELHPPGLLFGSATPSLLRAKLSRLLLPGPGTPQPLSAASLLEPPPLHSPAAVSAAGHMFGPAATGGGAAAAGGVTVSPRAASAAAGPGTVVRGALKGRRGAGRVGPQLPLLGRHADGRALPLSVQVGGPRALRGEGPAHAHLFPTHVWLW